MKPLTNDELLDKLLFASIGDGEQVYICDLCGAFAKEMSLFNHEPWCPEVQHGD